MMNNETGIYVHIPFCFKKCNYCDFVSFPKYELEENYFDKLLLEIEMRANRESSIKTIYFGGGTPSSVKSNNIRRIVIKLKEMFDLSYLQEMTIEVNPGICNNNNIQEYYDMGFNRLSIGVQTFDEGILEKLGRIHNRDDVFETIKRAKEAGFTNISIDLMYGLPEDSLKRISKDLDFAIDLNIQHISTYGLIIEKHTKFEQDFKDGLLKIPNEDVLLEMREIINSKTSANEFEHYEIANYARKGFESKHNLIYWNNNDYFGFGVNSTSKFNKIRFNNESDINDYINSKDFNKYNLEELTDEMIVEEAIFLGLRKIAGINVDDFLYRYNIDITKKYRKAIDELLEIKAMILDDKILKLTNYGIEISNYCMAKFLS